MAEFFESMSRMGKSDLPERVIRGSCKSEQGVGKYPRTHVLAASNQFQHLPPDRRLLRTVKSGGDDDEFAP